MVISLFYNGHAVPTHSGGFQNPMEEGWHYEDAKRSPFVSLLLLRAVNRLGKNNWRQVNLLGRWYLCMGDKKNNNERNGELQHSCKNEATQAQGVILIEWKFCYIILTYAPENTQLGNAVVEWCKKWKEFLCVWVLEQVIFFAVSQELLNKDSEYFAFLLSQRSEKSREAISLFHLLYYSHSCALQRRLLTAALSY